MPIAITSVTPVNGALPALLYDAAGSPLVLRDRALALGAQGGLPQIMLEGGVGRAGKGKFYVAEEQEEIAGCLSTTYEFSEWRDGTVLWIQSVYIPEKFRGQGVYKKLYAHVQELVHGDPGLKGIRLYVNKANHAAQRTYEKLGMNGEHYFVYEWMKEE